MKSGIYLKPVLVQMAHAAVNSVKTPYYAVKYAELAKRRGKKRAIIAIARMLLTATFHMLSTGEVWNPSDLQKVDMPQELREKQLRHDLNRAVKLLVANGVVAPGTIQIPVQAAG